ncbi:flagellar FlbD family protein [Brevibacillus humidisoli]|uniref:flagellar FlbD family protein n=1 Tax=Brevibacillus humidisoli TaxID=2895522 RepID=UPI001E53F4F3|nr:flagellar FlbD family protein [Brevibacillus humidisoli]UFJ42133.1 flagellar FlbD family protein [Brevibacillus humidisoli]
MIQLTRFNGSQFYLNVTHIELVEATPDTVITLANGKKYIVRESADEIARQVRLFYRDISMTAAIPRPKDETIE